MVVSLVCFSCWEVIALECILIGNNDFRAEFKWEEVHVAAAALAFAVVFVATVVNVVHVFSDFLARVCFENVFEDALCGVIVLVSLCGSVWDILWDLR